MLPRTGVPFAKVMRYPKVVPVLTVAPMKNSVPFVAKLVSELPFTTGEETGEQELLEGHWYTVGR